MNNAAAAGLVSVAWVSGTGTTEDTSEYRRAWSREMTNEEP